MAQQQIRVKESMYKELATIAKQRNTSVADATDWVLRFKLEQMHLADSAKKDGTKLVTDDEAVSAEVVQGVAKLTDSYNKIQETLLTVAKAQNVMMRELVKRREAMLQDSTPVKNESYVDIVSREQK